MPDLAWETHPSLGLPFYFGIRAPVSLAGLPEARRLPIF
jgi:hypothetical protein